MKKQLIKIKLNSLYGNHVYHDWINNASSDFCFEDYYGFVKEKIRSGISYSVINTYASEREVRK